MIGAIAVGGVAAAATPADNTGPVTGGRTVVADRPDLSARHPVADGQASVR
jgi:hypothetical protein